ncbi:MAG TPA: hypothetical protein VMW42_08980 [Desulfatiglandales bacterium]|nr:hypothetical protein [Desulfatiglandales bacterium]
MNPDENELNTACWAMWARESEREVSVEVTIDQAFEGYLFYPEPEWARFGYRPPENFPLIGAWRDAGGKVFIFLLDRTQKRPSDGPRQLLLYVSGDKREIDSIERRITSLKTLLAKAERRELRGRDAAFRLEGEEKAQSVERLMKLIGLFTVIVNGFSLYLRKLPPPTFPIVSFAYFYQLLLSAIHFAALFLLLLVIIICLFYTFQYGLLLLRRMWL